MPIRVFLDNGVKFTFNTDDPTVCNTNLRSELKKVADAFNLTNEDIVKLQLNAINASYASQEVKEEVIKMIMEGD